MYFTERGKRMSAPHILICDDDPVVHESLALYFDNENFTHSDAYDGKEALDLILTSNPDLILLDIMLPKINGYELMEYIRPMNIPVIFITAKASLDDRIKGLTSGAEDYLVKPFEIVELLARINIVLRRYNKTESILTFKDITVDTENHIVKKGDTAISLTPKEFELLVVFIRNKNITLFRDRLYELVWPELIYSDELSETRTLDLHIQRLRKKLDLKNDLKTIYNAGYRLAE